MQGENRAIELKGIVRSSTLLDAEDGQCEDLVNLIFKDGSWRRASDGLPVYISAKDNAGNPIYGQFFIHTNTYRHVLAVRKSDSMLCWIGNISDEGNFVGLLREVELFVVEGQLDMVSLGNIILQSNESGFVTKVFKRGEYVDFETDKGSDDTETTTNLYPEVLTNVRCVPYKREGKKRSLIAGLLDTSLDIPSGTILVKQMVENKYAELKRYQEKLGCPYGYFYVCVALRDYAGNFTCVSRPMFIDTYGMRRYPYSAKTVTGQWVEINRTSQGFDKTVSDQSGPVYADRDHPFGGFLEQAQKNPESMIHDTELGVFEYFDHTNAYFFGDANWDARNAIDDAVGSTDVHEYSWLTSGIKYGVNPISNSITHVFLAPYQLEVYYETQPTAEFQTTYNSLCIFMTRMVDKYTGLIDSHFVEYGYSNNPGSPTAVGCKRVNFLEKDANILRNELTGLDAFYLVKEIDIKDVVQGWNSVNIPSDVLGNLVNQADRLPVDANAKIGKNVYTGIKYFYNAKLHVAPSQIFPFFGYPLRYLAQTQVGNTDYQLQTLGYWSIDRFSVNFEPYTVVIEVDVEDLDETYTVYRRVNNMALIGYLNPIISYPSIYATKLRVIAFKPGSDKYAMQEFELSRNAYLNISYYLSPNLMPILPSLTTVHEAWTPPENVTIPAGNIIRVSMPNDPFVFPSEATYKIGNGRITALCSNTTALSTGQWGDAPLYVFCTDGVYALFVDASGDMNYTNARPISRDVCNNADSVTPIDNGVVFTTDRGLMLISGSQVQELSQPIEGDYLDFTNVNSNEVINICKGAFENTQLANMRGMQTQEDFLDYLTGAIIAYNHNERELWVSNPASGYSYVLDEFGNWQRRDVAADEYVNNYPVTYRLRSGNFYQMDKSDGKGGNHVFLLTRAIKLGTLGFKQGYRFVARGFFGTRPATPPVSPLTQHLGIYVLGSHDGRRWAFLGGNEKHGQFTDLGCTISRVDCRFFRICMAGMLTDDSRFDYFEIAAAGSRLLNQKLR